MSNIEKPKLTAKPLGAYLVEAGIITPDQVEIAINEQNYNSRRLGEILVERGWVKQETIEYFMEKVVLPEKRVVENKSFRPQKSSSYTLNSVKQVSQAETEDSGLRSLSAVPNCELKVYLYPKKTIRFLLIVVFGLVLASLIGRFNLYFVPDYPLRDFLAKIFNVDGERNIPALYSTSALLFCSILLAIIAYAKTNVKRVGVAGNQYVRHWAALSFIFLFLSVDELISIHERLVDPVRSTLNTSGFFHFAWVIPGAIFVLVCLLAFLQFLNHLPAKTKHLFLIAGTVYIMGTIGMELVAGYHADLHGQLNMTFAVLATIEECVEMLGIVIFVYALMSYITFYLKGMSIRINIINDNKPLNA